MPNFDGGHYFLSALIPIQEGLCYSIGGEGHLFSHAHSLREILAALPTENISADPSASDDGSHARRFPDAPFSRDSATHFCRMAVVDDTTFVGRQRKDPILTALRKIDPVIPEPVDHLPFPYLALIIDFDARDGTQETLRNYLMNLWQVMAPELAIIFEHCKGYDPNKPRDSFVKLVMDNQLETTMSFNDYYWNEEGGLWSYNNYDWSEEQGQWVYNESSDGKAFPGLQNKIPKIVTLPLLAAGSALLLVLVGGVKGWGLVVFVIVEALVVVYWIYRRVLAFGMQPFATAPRTDLPSVLKALYLQRQFIGFMINNQGVDPATLKNAFADFVAMHQPSSTASPTQSPGCFPS